MKVAIVGSGPAGLASARFLVQAGIIPKIFDSSDCVGGLWKPPSRDTNNVNEQVDISNQLGASKCWKSLHTNLSKYTCSFSDFPWHTNAPMFPSFHDMHKYLKAYADCYLKPEYFSFYSTVVKTSRKTEGGYVVEWVNEKTKQRHTEEFNAVVVASGFHNDSTLPDTVTHATSIPYIHSSAYRSPERYRNKRVVVVGASYSATEIAAEVSQYAKSVHNIQSRPMYIVPRYIPTDPLHPASPRLPLDMVFYAMNQKDVDAEVWSEDGGTLLSQPTERMTRSEEDRIARKVYFDKLVYGIDNGVIGVRNTGPASSASLNAVLDFPHISISDTFNQQRLANKIQVVHGRYAGAEGNKVRVTQSSSSSSQSLPGSLPAPSIVPPITGTLTEPLHSSESEIQIENVDEIIFCTGMRPRLDYLDAPILDALQYDKEDSFLPVVLYKETLHPDAPGLFFVGCYKGPYFAVMELQAVSMLIKSNEINPVFFNLLTSHVCNLLLSCL